MLSKRVCKLCKQKYAPNYAKEWQEFDEELWSLGFVHCQERGSDVDWDESASVIEITDVCSKMAVESIVLSDENLKLIKKGEKYEEEN